MKAVQSKLGKRLFSNKNEEVGRLILKLIRDKKFKPFFIKLNGEIMKVRKG